MIKYLKHFYTITKHRTIVKHLCYKCGLYKRGFLHDLSKYSPIEFLSSAKYYQGNRSPIDAEKEDKGYSLAWQHHKGHNPHHWEYWIDNLGTRENKAIKIPYEYVIEMLCDWVAASIVYSREKIDYNEPFSIPLDYYKKFTNKRIFHPATKALLEINLEYINEAGINEFCWLIKNGEALKYTYEMDL